MQLYAVSNKGNNLWRYPRNVFNFWSPSEICFKNPLRPLGDTLQNLVRVDLKKKPFRTQAELKILLNMGLSELRA